MEDEYRGSRLEIPPPPPGELIGLEAICGLKLAEKSLPLLFNSILRSKNGCAILVLEEREKKTLID